MSTASDHGIIKNLRHDFLASVVVFLVALPLCMGIAIASGAPPAAGLITGIIGGLVVGSISGSPLQVSGPAAGLAVVVYELIQREGYATLGVVLLIAGGIQLTAGLLKLGQWFRAVSPAVIHGMLAGIGVLIFASQFHVMVDDKPRGSGLANILALPEAIWKGIRPSEDTVHHQAALVGLFTIGVIILWKAAAPRKLQVIPAALLAVLLATVGTAVFRLPINLVDVPASIFSAVQFPTWDSLKGLLDGPIIVAALGLAFVASAETLLCATAVDKMHNGPRTQYDRELAAQGVGNMLCGLLGALPMTGVIVRSAANVEAGARSRFSAILHGGWLLIFVVAMPWVLRMIPTASLAALLVFTGYKLVNIKAIRELRSFGRGEVAIYAATVIMIVVSDLLTGVLVGIGISAAKLLYTFSHLEVKTQCEPDGKVITLDLCGTATFIRLPKLVVCLERIPPDAELHVRFEHLNYIDHACLDLLMNWEKQHEAAGGRLVLDWELLTACFRQRTGPAPDASEEGTNGRFRLLKRLTRPAREESTSPT
ncbi:MAG: SulP family inorganic anion transporter [Phycisphaerae bacterium]|jgi:MFS superfamily sulfate permease-like transporter